MVTAGPRRVFLGWERPALHAVVDALLALASGGWATSATRGAFAGFPARAGAAEDRALAGKPLDLRRLCVVLPAARAGRRLVELLVERAGEARRPLFLPKVLQVHALGSLLRPPAGEDERPAADALCRRIAWACALREAPAEDRAVVTADTHGLRTADWLGNARVLDDLYGEVTRAGLDFAEIAARGVALDAFPDGERWRALARLESAYLARLTAEGLSDARAEVARAARAAAAKLGDSPGGESHTPLWRLEPGTELVLACVPDLPPVLATLVRACGARVTSLVLAPETLAARFDDLGCIDVDAWRTARIDVPDEALRVADDPAGQAAEVVQWLSELPQPLAPEDVVVGVPDREVIPAILGRIEDAVYGADVPVEERAPAARDAEGTPLPRTPLFTLLSAVTAYLETRDTSALGALLRHPEVERRLGGYGAGTQDGGDVLGELDSLVGKQLQRRVPRAGEAWPQPLRPNAGREPYPALRDAVERIDRFLSPLEARSSRRGEDSVRPLPHWADAIAEVVRAFLDDADVPARCTAPITGARAMRRDGALDTSVPYERLLARGVVALGDVLQSLAQVPPALAPEVGATEALRFVLDALGDARVPHEEAAGAIELLGWLELPLDDAPHLIVTGFVEGRLPGATPASPYLPDRLRAFLGLDDDARRHARDAYALTCLSSLRPRLTLVTARRDAEGTPLTPSRLLLATDAEHAARRVLAFYRDDERRPPPPIVRALAPGVSSGASFPRIQPSPPEEPLTSLPVTAFRDYLACPYRFYLRHVLGLRRPSDHAVELDPTLFGSLAHEALRVLGTPELAGCTDARRIAEALEAALHDRVRTWLGDGAFPAVRLQVEQLRARLRAFATGQAAWAAEGKRIVCVEASVRDATLDVDGVPFGLTGRIDRIDVDDRTGTLYLLDYKTSDRTKSPEEAHRKAGRWVDLQLPLYRHLAARLDLDVHAAGIRLGYVTLPSTTRHRNVLLGEWSETDLAAADDVARAVVQRLRGPVSQRFWPPSDTPPPFSEEFAEICQDRRLGAAPSPEEEESDEYGGVRAFGGRSFSDGEGGGA
jgi:RecB family exonuclease